MKQRVQVNSPRAEQSTPVCGFPQVSIPEPLFYTFYINDLPNFFSNVESLLSADDTKVLCDHPDWRASFQQLNSELEQEHRDNKFIVFWPKQRECHLLMDVNNNIDNDNNNNNNNTVI